ncbi:MULTISPECIES: hypothetical protein [unclassified Flavobacterium]|uniref:hypothetical protein n=1 Tax=unclassified Flavobacterium TaxID=196869 RepID=UPI0006AB9677|nr:MULTISPECIES: hypothetical protein [unclassified Flavobacterium]KOP39663.1 hypothetical protein AKO67_03675 [Flavobacterium sp. VMW]OWU90216.1 hypothetical protein APR43_14155 [Flavobacterium sp. NLM]
MRTKFKNAARLIVVFMILITSTKCQTDDHLGQANDKTLLSAKQWFKNYETEGNNYALFQNLNYDWSDAAITNSEDGTKTIIVPINEVKKDPTETWEQKLYIYKLAENYYEASLIEIYPDKNNTDPNSSLIESEIFTGYISVGDLKKGFLKVAKFENGKLVENGIINLRSKSKTAKAPSNQVPCPVGTDCDTDTGGGAIDLKEVVVNNNYKDPSGYIITYNYGGWDYTGGITPGDYTNHGTGASGGSETPNIETTPPSCESFNFTSIKGANWQEAAVKNITLKIVVLTQNRVEVTNTMIFPQAVLFGMPINYNKGNGDVSSGAAATVSAMVLNETMKEMAKLYTRTLTNELTLRTKFQELLIYNYRMYTNGGTVNFNSKSPLPATNYKTNPRETGLCDN